MTSATKIIKRSKSRKITHQKRQKECYDCGSSFIYGYGKDEKGRKVPLCSYCYGEPDWSEKY